MPIAPLPKGTDNIDLSTISFSPEGDEPRTIGGETVEGFVREGNDLPLSTKKTLGDYLGRITAKDDFPVSSDTYRETSITSPTGYPNPLDLRDSDQKTYTNPGYTTDSLTGKTIPKVFLGDYTRTGGGVGDPDALKWTQENLTKGRSDSQRTYNGNSLLRNISGQQLSTDGKFTDTQQQQDAVVENFTSKILQYNRFTPTEASSARRGIDQTRKRGSAFGTDGGGRDSNNRFIHRHQSKFGVYDVNGPEIDPSVMDKIGPLLQLRATGELGANNSGYDPPDTMNFKTILPGVTQLGLSRVDTLNLEARKVLQDIAGGVPADGHLESDFELSSLSYGQINSYADPFSGLLPLGMSALAIALILAAQIAIDVFTTLMNLISTASSSTSTSRDAQGRHLLGKSYTNPGQESGSLSLPLPARLFGIEKTQHVYSDAIEKGLEVFFAVGLGRTVVEPGFFVVLLRSILASASTLVRKVKDIFGSGNPFNILNAVVGFLDAIRSSKIISAMNVFAHIGDQALVLDESNPSDVNRPSTVDDILTGTPRSAIAKNRDVGTLRLSWRSSTAPMSVLLPRTLQNAGATRNLTSKLVTLDRIYGNGEGVHTRHVSTDASENKIPHKEMKELESHLESEYVPFYFHDTRTNEITAFHAFLTTLTDNYAVSHDSTDAYGRVDPVKIYKNTVRTINVSFMVTATNEDDFDHMWMKINKLITLVYPQWSEGLVKKTEKGDKFIQPFSQVPAASPLVRLRIGDVIQSNYSRFALKRIFGYGSSNFSFASPDGTVDATSLGAMVDKDDPNKISRLGDGGVNIRRGDKFMLKPAPFGGYLMKDSKLSSDNLRNNSFRTVTVVGISRDGSILVTDKLTSDTFVALFSDLVEMRDSGALDGNTRSKDSLDSSFFSSGKVPIGSGPDDNANTIVRSFETAMSKGLACFITSMNFNWMEHASWETEIFGSRAPKIIKIDMSLAPIHDIAPGLDAYGANRALVYNVGQFANLLGDSDSDGQKQFDNGKRTIEKK